MIARIFVVLALVGALSCAPESPPKVDIQQGRPGTVVKDGVVIPLPQQVPGPKPAKQRRSAFDELPEHPKFRRDTPKAALPNTKEAPKSPATLTKDVPKSPAHLTRDVPRTPAHVTKEVPKSPAHLTRDIPKSPAQLTKDVPKPAVAKS